MGRTLVLGDVHGAARALEQVFDRAGLDPTGDRLISLGDLCDRWPEVDRCFDLVLEVEDRTVVLGNHDEWFAEWAIHRHANWWWITEEGVDTVASYARRAGLDGPVDPGLAAAVVERVPEAHLRLLEEMVPYHIEEVDGVDRLFTHGGWNPERTAEEQSRHDLRMSRDLWIRARELEARGEGGSDGVTHFDEVYLGHTPTQWLEPRPVLEIWNLDQAAGFDGVLTLMDADTKEYWQSDPVPDLYR